MCSVLSFIVLAIIATTRAEYEDIACCPSGMFTHRKESRCWTPYSNETEPHRLDCSKIFIPAGKTSITSDVIKVLVEEHNGSNWRYYKPDKACIGNETNRYGTKFRYNQVFVCIAEERKFIPDETLGICLMVSAVFLILTTVIYASLRELRDLHGKSIINLCGSLAIAFGILSIMRLMVYEDMKLCAVRGFLAYFFLMVAFFWTNSISVQILRCTRKPSLAEQGWKEFGWYALYSWGCPTVLTLIMAIVNFYPGNHAKPGIGLNHCWFFEGQQWYYMYSIVTIILCVNIFIFIYTSTIVWRKSFCTGHIRALRYRLTMMIRLVLIMGLLWIFEVITSLFQTQNLFFECLDLINTLQGPLMFLVLVVLRKRVLKAMLAHGWLGCISGPVEKYLADKSDCEEDIVQHTEIPMDAQH